MIKRPLAVSAVVFVIVLFFFSLMDESIFGRNPVKTNAEGRPQLAGFLQDDPVRLYGVVSDYEYDDRYGQTTTELILTDVHILLSNDTKDKTDSITNSNSVSGTISNKWKKITRSGQNILLYINKEETLSIGETILLSGRLSFFESASNPGQFDAKQYYENRDTLFAVKKAVIEKRTGRKDSLRGRLKEFGKEQEGKLEIYLSDAYASIMKAMLFGNKKELDEETKQLYQDNGIAHILAISGLHISLLGMSVYRLLRRLPFRGWLSLIGSEIFLLLYGCMVGFSASAFRAIGMFTFFLISKICKRSYDMITAVAFVAMLQLMIHPGYLFDCGFQLSYAAILGMGILLPSFQMLVKEIKVFWMQKVVALILPSLSVTLLTAPILIWHYHEISFFSILLNVIVIPFTGVLLLLTIAMLAAAEVCVPLAWVLSIPVKGILGFYEYSCRFLELFPIGQKNIAHPSMFVIFLYFMLLILMTVLVKQKRNVYQFLFPLIAAGILLVPGKPEFAVWMLDVGQGDCSVIFTEEGKCFVIDCGSTTEYSVGEKILIPFLKYHGIGRVDAVFVTHPDADHMNGIVELLECGAEENIRISNVVLYEKALASEPEEWAELVEAAGGGSTALRQAAGGESAALLQAPAKERIPIVGMKQGDRIQGDSFTLTCLYPLPGQSGLTGNASSLVLSLEVDRGSSMSGRFYSVGNVKEETDTFRALFTGDLEMEGEQIFLEAYERSAPEEGELHEILSAASQEEGLQGVSGATPMRYDLLKVGHHGSSGSSSEEFLRWASPRLAVISSGEDNVYGHPHAETLERLEAVGTVIFETAECGAIHMDVKGEVVIR